MTSKYEQELQAALRAVRLASRVCRLVQETITHEVLEKKDRSPVTVADFASQAVICRALEAAVPDDPIVGEEDASELALPENADFLTRIRNTLGQVDIPADDGEICRWIDRGCASGKSDRFWTLDPIDGTKGFLRREQYAVSLALIVDGRIQVAVLGCPNLPVDPSRAEPAGVMFWAVRGAGSWMLPLAGDRSETRVHVSRTSDPKESRFCESVESSHSSHDLSARVAGDLGITLEPMRLDSQAKYAVVARGEADIYMRLPQKADYKEKIWDHAGGVLIIEEAGGKVTDLLGRPLEFDHGVTLSANRGVLATNHVLHESVFSVLKNHYPPRVRHTASP